MQWLLPFGKDAVINRIIILAGLLNLTLSLFPCPSDSRTLEWLGGGVPEHLLAPAWSSGREYDAAERRAYVPVES